MKVKIEFEGKTTVPPAKLLRLAGGFWILDFFKDLGRRFRNGRFLRTLDFK